MFPKKGKEFPRSPTRIAPEDFAKAISTALRKELGSSHVAAKTVMRWTGASERTAKNWLGGVCGAIRLPPRPASTGTRCHHGNRAGARAV